MRKFFPRYNLLIAENAVNQHTLINIFVNRLNLHGWIVLLLFIWFFMYTIDSIVGAYWSLERSVFFYLIGGFIQLHRRPIKHHNIYMISAILTWITAAGVEYVSDINSVGADVTTKMKLISEIAETVNTAILYPIIAVLIFRIFEAIDIGSKETINTIAATTLGVYLIHDSIFGRLLIWNMILKVDTVQYPLKLFPYYAMSTILGVFVVCSCIDYLRLRFIEPVMMNKARKVHEIIKEKLMKK